MTEQVEKKPLARSEKEAKIKDKAGFVIVFLASFSLRVRGFFSASSALVVLTY